MLEHTGKLFQLGQLVAMRLINKLFRHKSNMHTVPFSPSYFRVDMYARRIVPNVDGTRTEFWGIVLYKPARYVEKAYR